MDKKKENVIAIFIVVFLIFSPMLKPLVMVFTSMTAFVILAIHIYYEKRKDILRKKVKP